MKRCANGFRLITFALFCAGCANQVTPAGGPRDTKPPEVVSSDPENYSTHFTSREIRITFDELIQVKELSSQLVVSPPLHHLPEARTKKKTLIVELEDTLKPNTTYSMNFGKAVGDLNESNAVENFAYVFSTGDFVDTLSITGTVMDAREQQPVKDVKVMLYSDRSDSVPFLSLPLYFGVTDSMGHFRVSNISAGSYKLFALKEADNNYLFDNPTESIAFLPGSVEAGGSVETLNLFLEIPSPRLQRVYSEQPGKLVVVVNAPAPELQFLFAGDTSGLQLDRTEWNARLDTAVLWYRNTLRDSISLLVRNGLRTDTATLRLKRTDDKISKQGRFGLNLAASVTDQGFVVPEKPVSISASHPVVSWDASAVRLLEDSIPAMASVRPDSTGDRLTVQYAWKENSRYRLLVLPGAAKDIFGLQNDTLSIGFRTRTRIDYGTIQVKLSSPAFPASCIFQLINEKNEPVRESICSKDTTLFYEFLEPGQYRMRMVHDKNGNGKENTGHYLRQQQPEPVAWYREKLTVRANWDVEISWKAMFPGEK